MTNKQPPFEINERIMADVIEIAELVGRVSVTDKISMNPTLRRTNRIQTIYSSLAIEQNTLDLEQVTAVLSGKRVIAPPKDIAEVQNAYEIYDNMDKLNPYSIDDILKAHSVMERGLLNEAGEFRSRPVGVYFIMNLNLYIRSQTATVVWEDCGTHYCFQNGILYSHGCR